MIAWIIGAAAVAVLMVVLVAQKTGPTAQPSGAPPAGMGGAAATSDISSMSPRERADRLFDRVMRAAAAGDSGEISFFAPMAVQSYGMLDAMDVDARYHVGLLEAEIGNFTGVLAQADSIEQATAAHLFVAMLRGEAARGQGNQTELTRWYRRFLDGYDRELATDRPEYRDHQPALNAFRDAARAALGAGR